MTTILVGLSPEACELIERLLSDHEDEHTVWVEQNDEPRGDEADIALAVKVLAELRVAKSHAENPERESQVASEPREQTTEPPQSEAAVVADKMAKAARKAVDTHEEDKG